MPDNITLRLRLLTHTPAVALLTAMLVLDRKESTDLKIAEGKAGLTITWARQPIGELMEAMEQFCQDQGWLVSRPSGGGLLAKDLVDLCADMGIAAWVGKRVVLDEMLFVRLQDDAEARMAYEGVEPLEDRLHAWMDGLTG